MKRKTQNSEGPATKIEFPWFLLGFILLSILGSYVLGQSIPVPDAVMEAIFTLTTWLLTAAMVGLGLNLSLKDVRDKAMRPLAAMLITSVALSVIVYFLV